MCAIPGDAVSNHDSSMSHARGCRYRSPVGTRMRQKKGLGLDIWWPLRVVPALLRELSYMAMCCRIQACIAIPEATPALIDRVEPNWAIE